MRGKIRFDEIDNIETDIKEPAIVKQIINDINTGIREANMLLNFLNDKSPFDDNADFLTISKFTAPADGTYDFNGEKHVLECGDVVEFPPVRLRKFP